MAFKTITIKEGVYKELKSVKGKNESFSRLLERLGELPLPEGSRLPNSSTTASKEERSYMMSKGVYSGNPCPITTIWENNYKNVVCILHLKEEDLDHTTKLNPKNQGLRYTTEHGREIKKNSRKLRKHSEKKGLKKKHGQTTRFR